MPLYMPKKPSVRAVCSRASKIPRYMRPWSTSEGGRAEEEQVRASQGQTPLQAALELLSTPSFPRQPESTPCSTPLPCRGYQWVGCRALCWPHQRVSWRGLLRCHSPWQPPEPPSSSGEERSIRKKEFYQPHSHSTLG